MSTRACVAYKTEDGWKGVYSHFDGYPMGLGKKIWDILHAKFIGNTGKTGVENTGDVKSAIQSFIEIYINGHRGGWSAFGEVCYCHDPAFVMRDGVHESVVTSNNPDPLFMEYVYILNPEDATMIILAHRGKEKHGPPRKEPERLPDGTVDYGHCVYWHEEIGTVNLASQWTEPDWEKLQTNE